MHPSIKEVPGNPNYGVGPSEEKSGGVTIRNLADGRGGGKSYTTIQMPPNNKIIGTGKTVRQASSNKHLEILDKHYKGQVAESSNIKNASKKDYGGIASILTNKNDEVGEKMRKYVDYRNEQKSKGLKSGSVNPHSNSNKPAWLVTSEFLMNSRPE